MENKRMVTKGEMWRGRINQEPVVNIHTVLETTNKDLQHTQGTTLSTLE